MWIWYFFCNLQIQRQYYNYADWLVLNNKQLTLSVVSWYSTKFPGVWKLCYQADQAKLTSTFFWPKSRENYQFLDQQYLQMDDSMYTVIDMTGAVKLSISPKFHKFIILYLYRHYRYRLTRVVPDKGPLNGCVCVCVLYRHYRPIQSTEGTKCLQCFDAVGWAARRASGL